MDAEYSGKVVRLMMGNHGRHRATPKAEIAELLSVPSSKVNTVLLHASSYVAGFDLEIVGAGCDEDGRQIELADRVFLRRKQARDGKQARLAASDDEKRLYLLFSLIQVEGNSLRNDRLEAVGASRYFDEVDIGDFMKGQRGCGYVASKKVDDVLFWSLGWRYYVEFHDFFDVVAHFRRDAPTIKTFENYKFYL